MLLTDVDECNDTALNYCDHSCTNTIGSYNCSCDDGYRLSSDGHTCLGNKSSIILYSSYIHANTNLNNYPILHETEASIKVDNVILYSLKS